MNRTFLARLTAAAVLVLGLAVFSTSAPNAAPRTVADSASASATTSPSDMGWQ